MGKEKRDILTKDFLIENYINNELSAKEISENVGCSVMLVISILKEFGIQARTISESKLTNRARKKTEDTNMSRYGLKNTFQLPTTKITLNKKYGVDNIFQEKSIISKIKNSKITNGTLGKSDPEKSNETKRNWSKEQKEKFSKAMSKTALRTISKMSKKEIEERMLLMRKSKKEEGRFSSKLEVKIANLLNRNNIDFIYTFYIQYHSYDFYIKNTAVLFEINGDYWHANPKIYNSGDYIKIGADNVLVDDIWNRDLLKLKIAEKYGYKVFYLWENEINNETEKYIYDFIMDKIDGNIKNNKN